ncbi:MAG: geranylgeranyl reductase family protein [Desulfohalobiaceae bacterium]|nr:geranylgeranyl reductase family protein [Desulfohalobiaceae bacterium]
MPNLDADVIIVGSGPGGCSAAHFLTKNGCRVLILEQKRLPRYKTCAGGVPDAGLALFPFSFDRVIEQKIHRFSCVCGRETVTMDVPDRTLSMVMRDRFDQYLLERSRAEVAEETRITGLSQDEHKVVATASDGRTFRARYLIGADGPNSRVAGVLGLRPDRRVHIALEAEATVPGDILRSFQGRILAGFDVLPAGYYWIFPKSDHLSVGIGSLRPGKYNLRQKLQDRMSSFGIDLSKSRTRAYPLPVFSRLEKVHSGRVLLVGDAAGLVDPYTGEGIRHAMFSGMTAAETILAGRIQNYTRRIQDEIARDLLWAKRLAGFFYARQHFSFHYLIRNRCIFQTMLKTITNQKSYKRAILSWPLYLFHLFNRQPFDLNNP